MRREKDPLLRGQELGTAINDLPPSSETKRANGRESQELEYHFTPSSSEPSTPWESERGSETSEYPIQALKELQVDVTVPGQGQEEITGQVHVSDQPATGPVWKLLPAQTTDAPQEVMLVQPSPDRSKKQGDQ